MGYASRSGRALANPRDPRAFGVCDRCGGWRNLHKLRWQHDWSGAQLLNLRLRVCSDCLDVPQDQLKARRLPADPVPVRDPRPEQFASDETTYLATSHGVLVSDDSGNILSIPE